MWDEPLYLGYRSFRSRLVVGTEGYQTPEAMRRCHDVSGAELVTVAMRRVDLAASGESVLDHLDRSRITILPGTAGSPTADEAVRTAYLGREAGLGDLVRLEVVGDETTGWPDVQGLLEATRTLVREGFTVLPRTAPDLVVARRLVDAGAVALLVVATPPGSGQGIKDQGAIRRLVGAVSVPILIDGGLGTASDAALALELGCHGVVVESAIPRATDPEAMAEAMKLAVEAGRAASKAGRMLART